MCCKSGTVRYSGGGAVPGATNPEPLLFFVAWLPQFMEPAHSRLLQSVRMAGTFAAIECATGLCASPTWGIASVRGRVGRHFNQVFGGVAMAIVSALPLRGDILEKI